MQGRPEEALAAAEREVLPFLRLLAVAMAQHATGHPRWQPFVRKMGLA
jgi:hypothetical protein